MYIIIKKKNVVYKKAKKTHNGQTIREMIMSTRSDAKYQKTRTLTVRSLDSTSN